MTKQGLGKKSNAMLHGVGSNGMMAVGTLEYAPMMGNQKSSVSNQMHNNINVYKNSQSHHNSNANSIKDSISFSKINAKMKKRQLHNPNNMPNLQKTAQGRGMTSQGERSGL